MKLKDIEVGKYYANSYEQRVLVLEVGVHGNVYPDSRWVNTVRSQRADYVQVKMAYEHKEFLHCRSIKHDWKTQEKIDKEKAEEVSGGEARVAYLWSILEKYTGLAKRDHWPTTRIELNHPEVEKVCEALERFGKDAGERHSKTPQN